MSIPPRTNSGNVQAILGNDYDVAASPDLMGYIASASAMTDQVSVCASNRGFPLTTVTAELVERWLSAYFYTASDPTYASKSTAGRSASFRNQPAPDFKVWNTYGQTAVTLDVSGCLAAMLKRATAGGFHMGSPCGCMSPTTPPGGYY
jgi:hypothetical protein